MIFQRSILIFACLLVPLLVFLYQRHGSHPRIRFSFSFPKPQRLKISPDRIQLFFRVAAFVLLILALARPQTPSRFQERKMSGIDIVFALDVSLSMLIQDMGSKTRMEIAKNKFAEFVAARGSDRIGLVVFAGEPLTLAPPTLDYGLLLQQVKIVQPGHGGLRDGTAIGEGLALAIQRLKNSTARSKVIVLLTDGDNNQGKIAPLTAAELAAAYGIKTYTIGLGSVGKVRQPFPQTDALGNTFYVYETKDSSIDSETLRKIATIAGGKSFRAQDEDSLRNVFTEIDRLEKTDVKKKEKILYDEWFAIFAIPALILLLLDRILALAWWRQWA